MFEWVGLALVVGILRAAHGEGEFPRIVTISLLTLITCLFYMPAWYICALVFGGFCLGLIPGWGKYLTAMGLGRWNKEEKEISFIDYFINKLDHPVWSPIIGMSLRWFIFFLPLFVILSRPEYALGLLLIGPMYAGYRLLGNTYDPQKWFIIEYLTGCWLGVLLFI